MKDLLNIEDTVTNLEKQLENINEDKENKKQSLLTLIAYNIKLFAEKDETKIKEIKKEMNDFVSEITIDGILG